MIFGISGTKQTVRNREVSIGVCKERLDCSSHINTTALRLWRELEKEVEI